MQTVRAKELAQSHYFHTRQWRAAGAVLVGRPSDAAAAGVGTVEKEESAGNKTIRKGSETCR